MFGIAPCGLVLAEVRAWRQPILLGVAVSSLGHVLMWRLLPSASVLVPHPAEELVSVELQLVSERAEPVPVPERERVVSAPASAPSKARAKETVARVIVATPEPRLLREPSMPPPTPAPSPIRESKVRAVDLSPLAASRSVFDVRAAPEAALDHKTRKPEPEVDGAQRLDAYLAQVARNKPWLSRADDPVLTREPDGSLSHDGTGFDAVIEPDGRVHFDDKYADFELSFKPEVAPDGSVTFVFFKLHFSLDVWLDKQFGKGDPFRAERRFFLERTAGLREERMQKHWERVARAGVVSLRHTLQDIWHDAKLDLAQRKFATFSHWDSCADDEIGTLGRAVVEAFVRERCPEQSACAYQTQDLDRLNEHRRSRNPFAPYATP